MGVIMKNKINYTGGGGSGGASALADLEDVELTTPTDGQALVYDAENDLWVNGGVVGSGGGSAKYTEKELWSGTLKTVNATASLSESIYNFDQIKILWTPYKGTDSIYHSFITIPVSDVIINQTSQFLLEATYYSTQFIAYASVFFSDNQTMTLSECYNTTSNTDVRVLKVIGIKWETMQTALIYSEEEREVGVWTDGKPLYQKTFNFINITTLNSWVSTNHNISNVDKIIDYNAIFTRTSDNWTVKADHYEGSSTAYISSNADKTQIHFKIAISSGTYNGSFTIWYTKTTDTPGSGIWTTTGEYAHHYSTDEKVVGTWIDGSTIYEKTLHPSTIGSGDNSIAHGITNADKLISASGSAYSGTLKWLNIPTASTSLQFMLNLYGFDSTVIHFEVGTGYTGSAALTDAYITIRYTKSS